MINKPKDQNKRASWLVRLILVGIMGLLLSSCGPGEPEVYRVGILGGVQFTAVTIDQFKAKMTELGYIEGENIIYDVQITDFDEAAYEEIIQQFVSDEVDLIFALPTEAALVAKAATAGTDIPVLFEVTNIEGTGLVESVQAPGGNITGVRYPGVANAVRRFEILHQTMPEADQFLLPYLDTDTNTNYQLEAIYPVAEAAGVTLIEMPVLNAAELSAALQPYAEAAEMEIDAIMFPINPLATTPDVFAVIAEFAQEHQIPMVGTRAAEDNTAIIHVTVELAESGEGTAIMADKILKGTDPGTIPVVSPETYLIVYYDHAQALGLTIPEGVLALADEIIR